MPKARSCAIVALPTEQTRCSHKNSSKPKDDGDARYVKVIVFDELNRVLAVNSKNKLILPGGKIEWDDDDAETAARREVFEAANMAIGLVIPVTVLNTTDSRKQTIKTAVFAARMSGEVQIKPNQKSTHRFLCKEAFFEATSHRNELMCTLVDAALRALVSEEIKEDHEETTQSGREKYNARSIL